MNVLLTLLVVLLMAVTSAPQAYRLLKRGEKKPVWVMGGLLVLSMFFGMWGIFRFSLPSFSTLVAYVFPSW